MIFGWDKAQNFLQNEKDEGGGEKILKSFLGKPGERKQFEINSGLKVIK